MSCAIGCGAKPSGSAFLFSRSVQLVGLAVIAATTHARLTRGSQVHGTRVLPVYSERNIFAICGLCERGTGGRLRPRVEGPPNQSSSSEMLSERWRGGRLSKLTRLCRVIGEYLWPWVHPLLISCSNAHSHKDVKSIIIFTLKTGYTLQHHHHQRQKH